MICLMWTQFIYNYFHSTFMQIVCLLLLSISLAFCEQAILKKVLLTDPDALCLDGTHAAYYIQRGTNPNKIILYFDGGGWCGAADLAQTLQSCYKRSKGDLGSTKNFPETMIFSDGILSNNEKNSFRDATKVFLSYCDGAGHQGYRQSPINYKDTKLYFRGHNITKAQITDVDRSQQIFTRQMQIIIAGNSAGGLAVFLWSNYIAQKVKSKNIRAISDSGIFLDSLRFQSNTYSYRNSMINLLKLSNIEQQPPQTQCLQLHKEEPYKCMFAEQLYKNIKIPLFCLQSLYDTWSISQILGIHCIVNQSLQTCNQNQRDYIEQYRRNVSKVLENIGKQTMYRNGYWAPACAVHSFLYASRFYNQDYRVPMESKYSAEYSVSQWVNQSKQPTTNIDIITWPLNKPCSGIKALQQFQ